MKLSCAFIAATLSLSCVTAVAADLGTANITSGSAGFSNTPVAGAFSDILRFTLTSTSFFNGSVTSVVNGSQDVDFSSISVSGPSGVFSFSNVLGDPVEVWATPGAGFTLAAGLYTLTLTGTNSAGIGSYAGNIAVTAVPEPETAAMLLAGMLGVGYMVRRRS